MKTAIIVVDNTITMGSLFGTTEADFTLSAVNPCMIKRISGYISVTSYGDNSSVVKDKSMRITSFPIGKNMVSTAATDGSLAMQTIYINSSEQIDANILIPPNQQMSVYSILTLVGAGTSDLEFSSTLIIDYEEL